MTLCFFFLFFSLSRIRPNNFDANNTSKTKRYFWKCGLANLFRLALWGFGEKIWFSRNIQWLPVSWFWFASGVYTCGIDDSEWNWRNVLFPYLPMSAGSHCVWCIFINNLRRAGCVGLVAQCLNVNCSFACFAFERWNLSIRLPNWFPHRRGCGNEIKR